MWQARILIIPIKLTTRARRQEKRLNLGTDVGTDDYFLEGLLEALEFIKLDLPTVT